MTACEVPTLVRLPSRPGAVYGDEGAHSIKRAATHTETRRT